MAGKTLGIVKAHKIILELDVQTLQAIEDVLAHHGIYGGAGVFTGIRLMKLHKEETPNA